MTHPVSQRVEKMFEKRTRWDALWDITYRYVAPERAVFFQAQRDVNSVMERVYDSTAVDAAERLTNLIASRLCPPWQKWFRAVPGPAIRDPAMREQMQAALQVITDLAHSALARSNFYQEIQPTLLDRVVGGTCGLSGFSRGREMIFSNVPLQELALEEDAHGRVHALARKYTFTPAEVLRLYRARLTDTIISELSNKNDTLCEIHDLCTLTALGDWAFTRVLKHQEGVILESSTTSYARLMGSRWAKIPGEAYGRGPALRALSDTRALNRVKELTLKHAARAVSGVYTVLDDGIINPYTISLEPMTFLPVGSNDLNNPSIRELPPAGDLNTAAFVVQDLRSSILKTFLADQFGPLERTPRSATEVAERTRIIAQELGATIARLQYELLTPVLRLVITHLQEHPDIKLPEMDLDDETFRVEYVSQLAQAQQASEEQNILEFAMTAVQFGEVDPKAGLVIDVHEALRRVAELKSIDPALLRSHQQVEELLAQAGQTAEQAQAEGVPLE